MFIALSNTIDETFAMIGSHFLIGSFRNVVLDGLSLQLELFIVIFPHLVYIVYITIFLCFNVEVIVLNIAYVTFGCF